MTSPPRFAISIPVFVADGTFDPAAFRAYLARVEALGFDQAWTTEQILGPKPHLGPLETLTYAAACSERLRLGCAVLVTPLYSPVHLAKSLSTLDQMSRGRLEVGVSTGGRFRQFAAFGVDPGSLVARFTEGLALMRALWAEDRVTFPGRFWQLEGAAMEPKPFQKPHPPLWFGASHPDALRRAVRLGDGFFGAGSQTTAQFAEQVRVVRAAAEEQGREGYRIAKRVYIAVDDDAGRARADRGRAPRAVRPVRAARHRGGGGRRHAGRVRARPARRRRRGRGADPGEPDVRRRGADGAAGGRSRAARRLRRDRKRRTRC